MKRYHLSCGQAARIFAVLSVLLTVLLAGCLSAAADDSFTEGDFQFTVTSDASCSVEVYNGSDTYVSVPGNAGGYLVTAIADCAFYQNGALQTVVLPDGIETIGEYAFYECTALSQITLPEGLRTIGLGAFLECVSLTSVSLPASVQLLQKGAFGACSNLHTVWYMGTMPECEDQVFAKCADDFQIMGLVEAFPSEKRADQNKTEENYAIGKVGDITTLGHYPQTSSGTDNTPIEWRVLDIDVQNNKVLLISEYALDTHVYNEDFVNVTWEKCSLRSWLNNEFLTAAFSEIEQGLILPTEVKADRNPVFSSDPGNDTVDKVFLLSSKEMEKYFADDESRQCKKTRYVMDVRGAWQSPAKEWAEYSTPILRTPGETNLSCDHILPSGTIGSEIGSSGASIIDPQSEIRPAVWIAVVF